MQRPSYFQTFSVTRRSLRDSSSVAVILGAFSGSGGSTGGGDIFFEGNLRPGNSPATVTFDNNVSFGSGASLDIELGGAALREANTIKCTSTDSWLSTALSRSR
jgi:hypothetical protein